MRITVRPGSIIEFKDKKGITLAVCRRLEGTSVRLLTEGGKEFSFPADKVLHATTRVVDASESDPTLREALVELRQRFDEQAAAIRLEDLWDFFAGGAEDGISLRQMARTYYGEQAGSDEESAMLRVLHDDPLYFKKKGELYVPKAAEAVQETRRQLADHGRRERERDAALGWLRAARVARPASEPEGLQRHLELLKGLAVNREECDSYNEASALLRDLGEEVPDGAFPFLVEIGVFRPDENLLLLKDHIPTHFSDQHIAAAEEARDGLPGLMAAEVARAVPPPPLDEPAGLPADPGAWTATGASREVLPRVDLRSLELVSIDDSDTAEVDDALSLEKIPGGHRVGVHIADLSAFIARESVLDTEAFRRATTIYMPEVTIPMLPQPVSHAAASLVTGEDRLALSLLADLNDEGTVMGFRFVPSVIRVSRAMPYEDASELCAAQDSSLSVLSALAAKLREARVKRGARIFARAELKLRVSPEGEITLKKRQGENAADILVSEMMILANQLAGLFCAERQVPTVYRVQPPPVEEIASGGSQPVSRRFLGMVKKIQVLTQPGPHWGLGLPCYVQMTSPIRRYLDLVAHRQLKGALGEPGVACNEEELRQLIGATETAVDAAHNVQRWSSKYWLLKYLAGRQGELTPAVIQELRDESYLVQLTDYLIDIPFYAMPGRRYQVGEMLDVKIKTVDPRRGVLKVQG
jgi:exoribonuclease-2